VKEIKKERGGEKEKKKLRTGIGMKKKKLTDCLCE